MIIDPIKCNGCKDCIAACPYQAIYFNDELKIAQKCTMCAHLLDDGWEEPRCVSSCPTEAIRYGEDKSPQYLKGQAEILALGDKPSPIKKARVVYLGQNKRFIAGDVYCPQEDKRLEGAQITLTNLSNGEKSLAKTDNYGDFWLNKLNVGLYQLVVEKDGYYPKEINSIDTAEDVNIGTIKLYKKV